MEPSSQNVAPIALVTENPVNTNSDKLPKKRIILVLAAELLILITISSIVFVLLNYFQILKLRNTFPILAILPTINENKISIINQGTNENGKLFRKMEIPTSTKIADLPNKDYSVLEVSPDMKKVILRQDLGQGQFKITVPNCSECAKYDEIKSASFNPKTGDLLLIGIRHAKYFISFKNKEYGPYEPAPPNKVFSIGGRTVGNPFTGFTIDLLGNHTAYTLLKDGKHKVYKDGVEIDSYDIINDVPTIINLVFSPNGDRLSYGVSYYDSSFVVVDGVRGPVFNIPMFDSYIVFTLDSKHVIYNLTESGTNGGVVYIDGVKTSKAFWKLDTNMGPIFVLGLLGDYAYVLDRVGEHGGMPNALVYDGKEIDNGVDYMLFSSNGTHFAYIKRQIKGTQMTRSVILDNKVIYTGSLNVYVWGLQFSADNNHIYFFDNGKIIQDGTIIKEEPSGEIESYIFSPDQKRMMYIYQDKVTRIRSVDVDGKKYTLSKYEDSLGFSPDSKHFAFIDISDSNSNVGTDRLMVDGVERPTLYNFEYPIPQYSGSGPHGTRIKFTEDSSYIEYITIKDNELWHMVEKL